jgi:hypothetical protein
VSMLGYLLTELHANLASRDMDWLMKQIPVLVAPLTVILALQLLHGKEVQMDQEQVHVVYVQQV